MGRYPRYELARAFRSLWISYRTPMQLIGNEDNGGIEIICSFLNKVITL